MGIKYTLNDRGSLCRNNLACSCPFQKDDMECSDWCPLFFQHDAEWKVTLYCGCVPITYTIDDVVMYDGN